MLLKKPISIALTLAAGALAASVCAAGRAALAQELGQELRSTTVHYGDLNIGSLAGLKALRQRVHRAADQVCGPRPRPAEILKAFDYETCVRDTEARALMDFQVRVAAVSDDSTGTPIRVAQEDRR